MKVLFLTTLYAPDIGANARIMTELAQDVMARGHEVTVVTTHPHYTAGTARAPERQEAIVEEVLDGVRVIRIATFLPRRRTLAARALSFASYMRAAPRAARRLGIEAEAIVAICPPLTTGFAAWRAARVCRAPWAFLIQDLYPETAIELGYVRNPVLVRLARAFGDFIHKRASHIGVISAGFRAALVGHGIPAERISLVPNWVDTDRFRPDAAGGEEVRRELGLEGLFVVLFAGTMGLAQGLESVAPGALERLAGDPGIAFVFLGGGLRRAALEAECLRRGFRNTRFVPPQPHERMPRYLAAADAYLVHLRDIPLYRVTIPSKTYEYLAMGRPVLMAVRGEAAALIEGCGAGIALPPEDPGALAEAVRVLAADAAQRQEMGGRGRREALNHYSRPVITGSFITEIETMAAHAARGGNS